MKRKQQALLSVSLDMVEHLRDRMFPGKMAQSGADVRRKCEVINIGHWGNRIANYVHGIASAMR